MSQAINASNVYNVRSQIALEKQSQPFHATVNYAKSIVTDYDNFPYGRWYRGQALSDKPIVAEREAGWRPRQKNCYSNFSSPVENKYPNHCFETACSTVFPCYPKYLQKFSDQEQMNVILNKACIVQYR